MIYLEIMFVEKKIIMLLNSNEICMESQKNAS